MNDRRRLVEFSIKIEIKIREFVPPEPEEDFEEEKAEAKTRLARIREKIEKGVSKASVVKEFMELLDWIAGWWPF